MNPDYGDYSQSSLKLSRSQIHIYIYKIWTTPDVAKNDFIYLHLKNIPKFPIVAKLLSYITQYEIFHTEFAEVFVRFRS
jgi:hypothetical protein